MTFFEPLPSSAPPSKRVWAAPAWDRPSEGTIPATLSVDATLHEDDNAVWWIPTLDVFPNGFRINVTLQLNPHRQDELLARIQRPIGMMRFGVRFSDGRAGGRGRFHGLFELPKDEHGVPTTPIVRHGGGSGGNGIWQFAAWVFPLPPDGPLEIFVAPPPPVTGEFRAVVDGTTVRAAADRARVIWT